MGIHPAILRRRRRSGAKAPVITNLVIDASTDPIGVSFDISTDADIYGIYTVNNEQVSITADNIIAGKLQDGTTNAALALGPIPVTEPGDSFNDDITALGAGTIRIYLTAKRRSRKAEPVTASFVRTV